MKNNLIRGIFLILSFFVFFMQNSQAETVQIKAVASVSYESSGLFSSKPPKGTEAAAVKIAKNAAWKKYISSFSDEKRNSYDVVKSSILSRLDDFIIGHRVIDKLVNKDSKTLTVQIRVEIDDSAVQSKIYKTTAKGSESEVYFTWIFVTRAQDSVKKYQDRITNMSKSEKGNSTVEKTNVSDTSIVMSDQTSSTSKRSTGGSTVSKRDKVSWVKLSSKEINSEMTRALVNAGYEAIEYGDIQSEEECGGRNKTVEEVQDEFVAETDLSSQTTKGIKKTAKRCDIKFTAIGTLDILKQNIDPSSGLVDVYVSVTAKVYDTSKRFAKTVASVGPVQYHGLGPEEPVARNNALSKAAKKAAESIINQLRARGSH
ncbi:hypothetical protein R5P06_07320 [Candidatus Thioglobus autotrophicus]|nr:hypothetical protein [Candidatus Thioglobus autotrophicus]WPE16353.1 hypothetical protein R5P06_07320 [Candidatus Thioglobus autotrophicus]